MVTPRVQYGRITVFTLFWLAVYAVMLHDALTGPAPYTPRRTMIILITAFFCIVWLLVTQLARWQYRHWRRH